MTLKNIPSFFFLALSSQGWFRMVRPGLSHCFHCCPQIISPTLPTTTKRNLIHSYVKYRYLLTCLLTDVCKSSTSKGGKALEKRLDLDSLVSEDLRIYFPLGLYKILDTEVFQSSDWIQSLSDPCIFRNLTWPTKSKFQLDQWHSYYFELVLNLKKLMTT